METQHKNATAEQDVRNEKADDVSVVRKVLVV